MFSDVHAADHLQAAGVAITSQITAAHFIISAATAICETNPDSEKTAVLITSRRKCGLTTHGLSSVLPEEHQPSLGALVGAHLGSFNLLLIPFSL